MSLSKSFARRFPAHIRARGEEYFETGRVTLVDSSPGAISAVVRGTDEYVVTLSIDGPQVHDAECTCPWFRDHLACKHIWGTLVAAEEEGWLDEALRGGSSLTEATSTRFTPQIPEWRRRLLAARPTADAAHHQREQQRSHRFSVRRRIIYVVNVPESRAVVDGLVVELHSQKHDRDGGWSSLKPLQIPRDQWLEVPDLADREIAQLLLGARPETYPHHHGPPGARRFVLGAGSVPLVLRRICETGRCRLRTDVARNVPLTTLEWDDGDPWELVLSIEPHPGEADRFRAVTHFRRDSERMELGEAEFMLRGGWVIARGRIAATHDGGATDIAVALGRGEPLVLDRTEAGAMLEELNAFPAIPRIELAPEVGIAEQQGTPRPVASFHVRTPSPWMPARTEVEIAHDYDGVLVEDGRQGRALFDAATNRLLHRNLDAESAARLELLELGVRQQFDHPGQPHVWTVTASRAPRLMHELLAQGWRVEHEGSALRVGSALTTEVRSGIDWFDLTGLADFGGIEVEIARLIEALARGDESLTLPDGSLGLIPDDWRRRFGVLAGMGEITGDALRFGRAQAGVLDALLAALPPARVDETFARVRAGMRAFEGVTPLDAPPGFVGELRPYQREGLGWLEFLRRFGFGGCLADDMGLGKTVQALAMLERRRAEGAGPSLVVVPRSLVSNWEREAARFAPSLRVVAHHGTTRRRDGIDDADADLIITTYGTLRRDIATFGDAEFDYAILDEAQAIKNPSTQTAKAVRLIRARHRLAMSGTPVENRLAELWSLFEFLNPGMLGTAAVFKRGMKGLGDPGPEGEESRALLGRALRPFILRRTKAQVAPELPERSEQTIVVDLEPAQRKLYDRLRDEYRASLLGLVEQRGLARSKMKILEALLRLRQAACHPGLIDATRRDDASAKLDVLVERLSEVTAEGHKSLVFSQFTSLLALVRPRLDAAGIAYEYLDGRTMDRAACVDRFQNDASRPVFLISLKAGGTGLNLTAAEYVFLLDPWWNPAVEAQAIDRAHRIGQQRRVLAARLIARDTVEEKILELQATKRALADAIVGEDNAVLATLGREELEMLLG